MLKNLIRTAILICVSASLIFVLHYLGWLQVADLKLAFERNTIWVVAAVLGQVMIAMLSIVRYVLALMVSQVSVSIQNVAAASLISQAIGQWFSGSLAIMEAARFGIMLGDSSTAAEPNRRKWQLRLVTSSLFERVIGQATMLVCGGLASLAVAFFKTDPLRTPFVWFSLIGMSLVGGFTLGATPLIVNVPIVRKLMQPIEIKKGNNPIMILIERTLSGAIKMLQKCANALKECTSACMWWTQVGMSVSLWLSTSLTFYFTLRATEAEVSLLAVAASLPLMTVASIVPLGFAGFGGNQLVTVAVLGLLDYPLKEIIAASLLSNCITLIVQTVLGVLAYGRCHKMVLKILQDRSWRAASESSI